MARGNGPPAACHGHMGCSPLVWEVPTQRMWPLASKRARDKHTAASLKGRRAGGATTVTAGQRTPSGALMAKALTDGADEAKSGGMGTGRASRTPRGSPGAIWTELWAPQGGYVAAAAKPVWIPLQRIESI